MITDPELNRLTSGNLRFKGRPQDGDIGYYNESGYVGSGPIWVQWRYPGERLSKAHILSWAGAVMCGKKAAETITLKIVDTAGHCERCKLAWAKGRR